MTLRFTPTFGAGDTEVPLSQFPVLVGRRAEFTPTAVMPAARLLEVAQADLPPLKDTQVILGQQKQPLSPLVSDLNSFLSKRIPSLNQAVVDLTKIVNLPKL
jgi:hypothetical protein